jgi:hypothetical protein
MRIAIITESFPRPAHPSTYDGRVWSADRLHPNERGHRLLAGPPQIMSGVPNRLALWLDPMDARRSSCAQ